MYKFQSMCLDTKNRFSSLLKYNEVEEAIFKIKDELRVTN